MTAGIKRTLVIALVGAGCRVAPPTATLADAQRGNVQLAELQDGRAVMVRKCGNCHAPPHPHDHTAADWPRQLDEMSSRANLDTKQRYLIEQYFIVMSTH